MLSLLTYDESERNCIGRLIDRSSEETFKAAPIFISFDTSGLWKIGCNLMARDLYPVDYVLGKVRIDQNVVRLDICKSST